MDTPPDASDDLSTRFSRAVTLNRPHANDYRKIRTLGTGTFARVYLVQHNTSGLYCAMKILKKDHIVHLQQVEHVNHERAILGAVRSRCPFIVEMQQYWQDSRSLYMTLTYAPGGELFSHLRRAQRFSPETARFYAAEVIVGLDYLHSLDIIYRDLKPENLLLDAAGHIKIADLGFAKHVTDRTYTVCGTPDYLAPEIILNRGYGKAVDWWAVGILIFEMLAGYPPFFHEDPLKTYEKIIAGQIRFPADFDVVAKDLARKLITSDLTRRLGNMRGGTADIQAHPWFRSLAWGRLHQLPAPIVPQIAHAGDASNFDDYEELDEQPPPADEPDLHGRLFRDFDS
eukprot:TRINITY_DN494_c0_g1_i1.p1 TRINITY_DN494_c0_g1~~TRINITY_DN494_c0_g1_i1.p1  ORF type:complete len:342 (+),score=70.55 TRINITY_DN494_c0_g1_i1:226-1251(+)